MDWLSSPTPVVGGFSRGRGLGLPHDLGRDPCSGHVRRNRLDHDRSTPNLRTFAHFDVPEHGRPRANEDPRADLGMAVVCTGSARAAEGHAVQEGAVGT